MKNKTILITVLLFLLSSSTGYASPIILSQDLKVHNVKLELPSGLVINSDVSAGVWCEEGCEDIMSSNKKWWLLLAAAGLVFLKSGCCCEFPPVTTGPPTIVPPTVPPDPVTPVPENPFIILVFILIIGVSLHGRKKLRTSV